ncbi:MAG: hypothetical protein NZ585_03075 [Chloracidobacterium sp.]|nr:hypothetical protein [Chloracidobacterium sp.]MDW8217272.1 hypothetical protein [Acidobacteriota bacterium]
MGDDLLRYISGFVRRRNQSGFVRRRNQPLRTTRWLARLQRFCGFLLVTAPVTVKRSKKFARLGTAGLVFY